MPDAFTVWTHALNAAIDALARPSEILTQSPPVSEVEELARLLDLRGQSFRDNDLLSPWKR
jgi:hypothetical protein